jgi:hypothetical protein
MGTGIILAIVFVIIMGIIGGPSLLNTSELLERKQAREIVAVINGVIMQRQNYQFEFSQPLPTSTWQSALNFQGAFVPRIENLTMSYNVSGSGAYFCLTIDEVNRRKYFFDVFTETVNLASFNAYINDLCGSTSDFTSPPNFSTTNVTITVYAGS